MQRAIIRALHRRRHAGRIRRGVAAGQWRH